MNPEEAGQAVATLVAGAISRRGTVFHGGPRRDGREEGTGGDTPVRLGLQIWAESDRPFGGCPQVPGMELICPTLHIGPWVSSLCGGAVFWEAGPAAWKLQDTALMAESDQMRVFGIVLLME